jgi:hypothetical protein
MNRTKGFVNLNKFKSGRAIKKSNRPLYSKKMGTDHRREVKG